MHLGIRPEKPEDSEAIHTIHVRAFGRPNEGHLVDRLRAQVEFIDALSLVALISGQIVGHILFTPIRVGAQSALALAPLAVLPEFQRRGIGAALVLQGLDACARLGHGVVIVVGHEGYYPRFGFVLGRPHGIEPPFPVPDEAWMVYEALSGALAETSGMVCYPAPFQDV